MKKLSCVLHIGLDTYPPLSEDFATKPIWQELAKVAEKYLVVARSRKHRFEHYRDSNLETFLVPKLTQPLYALASIYAVYLAWRHRPEVIVVQEPIIGGTTARLCRFVSHAKILMEVHSEAYFFWQRSSNLYLRLLAWLAFTNYSHADRIRALTTGFKNRLGEKGLPADRISVVPTRVSLDTFDVSVREKRGSLRKKFHIPSDALVFVSTGRFTPDKNHHLLLTAFELIHRRLPKTFLTLIGDGIMRDPYRQWITEHGLDASVILTGTVPPTKVAEFLAASDMYVHPSRAGTEALPRAVLEAMAMELPVIATNVAAIPEVVADGKSGIVIPPDDFGALTRAMEQLGKNQQLREQWGRHGLARVRQQYEWQKNFEAYRKLLLATAGES